MPYDMRNLGNPGTEPKNMGELLECIDEILLHNLMFNDKAMKNCHAMGFNGYKRMHRWNAKKFLCWHIDLENEAYDKYRMTLETKAADFDYNPSDLINHLQKWDMKLGEDIKALGHYNNLYREWAGKDNCVIDAALACMVKNYEKAGRWYKRFMETKSMHDMHDLDDTLHAKYKAMEEAAGY